MPRVLRTSLATVFASPATDTASARPVALALTSLVNDETPPAEGFAVAHREHLRVGVAARLKKPG